MGWRWPAAAALLKSACWAALGCGGAVAPHPAAATLPGRENDGFTSPGFTDAAGVEARFARHGWVAASRPAVPGPYRVTRDSLRPPTARGRGATYRTRTDGRLGPPQVVLPDLPGYEQMLVVAEAEGGQLALFVFRRGPG